MMQDAAEAEFVRCPHPVLQQTYHSGGPDTAHTLVDCEVCHGPTRVDTCSNTRDCIECNTRIAPAFGVCFACHERLRETIARVEDVAKGIEFGIHDATDEQRATARRLREALAQPRTGVL